MKYIEIAFFCASLVLILTVVEETAGLKCELSFTKTIWSIDQEPASSTTPPTTTTLTTTTLATTTTTLPSTTTTPATTDTPANKNNRKTKLGTMMSEASVVSCGIQSETQSSKFVCGISTHTKILGDGMEEAVYIIKDCVIHIPNPVVDLRKCVDLSIEEMEQYGISLANAEQTFKQHIMEAEVTTETEFHTCFCETTECNRDTKIVYVAANYSPKYISPLTSIFGYLFVVFTLFKL